MIKNNRVSDAAMATIVKILIGAALGGAIATSLAIFADNANAVKIEANTDAINMLSTSFTSFQAEFAVLQDRQIRIQTDINEIKLLLRERQEE